MMSAAGLPAPSVPGFLFALALLAFAFGFGLFFDGYYSILYAPAAGALLLLACACIVPACLRGAVRWPHSALSILLFAFWLFITISLSWSSVPFSSLITYLVFITLPLSYFASLTGCKDPRPLLHAAWMFLTAAVCGLGAFAVIQHFFIGGTFSSRAHLMFGDPNNLAAIFNLALFPALAVFLSAPAGKRLYAAGLAGAILFAGLCATESRGGMLCFIAGFITLALLVRGEWKRLLAAVAAAGVLFLLSGLGDDMRYAEKIAALADFTADSSASARLAIWEAALRYVQDHAIFGTGFGTYYLYAPSYRLPGADNSTGQWAHMDPLQLWAELGILAPVLFYAAAIAIALRTIRALKAPGENRAAIAGLFCAMLTLFLHAHITFQLYVIPSLLLLGLWLARWHVLTADALPGASFRTVLLAGWQKFFMAFAALCVALLIFAMTASSAAGIHYLLAAREAILRGDVEGFATRLATADRLSPASYIDPQVHMAGLYIDMLRNPVAVFSPQEKQALYSQTSANLDYAQKLNPAWWEIDSKRAELNAAIGEDIVTGSSAAAIGAWAETIRKYPMHFRARTALSGALVRQGRVDEALAVMKAGSAYPMPPDTRRQYAAATAGLEKLAAAAREYEAAKEKKAP